jgi:hypothetical protein
MHQPPKTNKRPAPFSLRLSFEERQQLERDALGVSLSAYIKERLFDDANTPKKRILRGKTPVKDHEQLAKLMAMLGASRLPQNMNQLAIACHIGNLPLQSEVEAELKTTCDELHDMRVLLLAALGRSS